MHFGLSRKEQNQFPKFLDKVHMFWKLSWCSKCLPEMSCFWWSNAQMRPDAHWNVTAHKWAADFFLARH